MNITLSTAEQTPLSQPLRFEAQSVVVDNLSASWCYVPDAPRAIPPWTYGATLTLTGTSQARLNWQTPSGLTPATPTSGTVSLSYYDFPLPPSNGQQVVIPSQQVTCVITSVVSLAGGATAIVGGTTIGLSTGATSSATVQVALPAGANSIIVTGGFNSGVFTHPIRNITIQGVESNTAYFDTAIGSVVNAIPGAAIISPAVDQHLQIVISNQGNTSAATFEIVASFGTQAVMVQGNPGGAPVNVSNGATPGSPLLTFAVGGTPYPFSASLASGGSLGLAGAATLGRGISGGFITVDAVATTAVLQIQDSAGAVTYANFSQQTVAWVQVPAMNKVGDGGLSIKNGGSATAFYRGVIVAL